jgi:hypothetical protein
MNDESTMFGKLLTSVQQQRQLAHDMALKDLWGRNGLSPNAAGYKIAETKAIHRDGREVTEYRLYKLIDASVTTIKAEVTSSVEIGADKAVEMKSWPEQQKDGA